MTEQRKHIRALTVNEDHKTAQDLESAIREFLKKQGLHPRILPHMDYKETLTCAEKQIEYEARRGRVYDVMFISYASMNNPYHFLPFASIHDGRVSITTPFNHPMPTEMRKVFRELGVPRQNLITLASPEEMPNRQTRLIQHLVEISDIIGTRIEDSDNNEQYLHELNTFLYSTGKTTSHGGNGERDRRKIHACGKDSCAHPKVRNGHYHPRKDTSRRY